MNRIYDNPIQFSSAFGLSCSSYSTCSSKIKDKRVPSLDSVSALLRPFCTDSFPNNGPSPLSLCLKCGAYPHSRNERVQPSTLGAWQCVFCGTRNNDGIANPPQPESSFVEAVEYTERYPCFESISSNVERIFHILAIDAHVFREPNFQSFLQQSCSHIPIGSKIVLIIVDEQLRIARLGQQSLVPFMIDVIPTSGSNLLKYLKSLTQSNQYCCPADFFQTNFEAIFDALHSTFASSAALRSPLYCLNSLVTVCSVLKDSIGTASQSAKCLMLLSRECRVSEHSLDSRQVKCSRYQNLGKKAYQNRCTFYAFQLGISALNVAGLDAFAAATGGFVVTAETLQENSFTEVFQQIFSRASTLIIPTDVASIEFRSTKSVEIERVTGPVTAIQDVVTIRRAQDKEFVEESLYLNENHFAAAIQSTDGSISTPSSSNTTIGGDMKKTYRKLSSSIKSQLDCCGLLPRDDLETTIAFQIRRTYSSNQDNGKSGSIWARLKTYPANLLQVDSSRSGREQHNNATQDLTNEEGIVQVIARFSYIVIDALRRAERVISTRVWTIKLTHVNDSSTVLRDLNVPLWSFGIMRGIVADFHDEIESTFDGPRPHRSVESDYSRYKQLKRKYEHQLDLWYKDLAIDWKSDTVKVIQMARYFYHCLEGPLLDGPSASCQEAYCLRSLFLRSSYKLAHNVLMPQLRLDMNYYPSGAKRQQMVALRSMPLDSTSLLPTTSALLDVGDTIILRRNASKEEASAFTSDDAMDNLISFAKDSAKNRFPACRVVLLKNPGGPLDRMLLCRLSPSHLDAQENILRRLHGLDDLQGVSTSDITISTHNMPVTDQIYFQQFLALKSGFAKEDNITSSTSDSISLTSRYPPPSSAPPLSATITAMDRGLETPAVDSFSEV